MKLLTVFLLAVAYVPQILTNETVEVSNCVCPANYDPVCANDYNTYGNICLLNCENIKRAQQGLPPWYILYKGECQCNCRHCPSNYNPVCGSDGRTYWNVCWLTCYSDCNVAKGLPCIEFVRYGHC